MDGWVESKSESVRKKILFWWTGKETKMPDVSHELHGCCLLFPLIFVFLSFQRLISRLWIVLVYFFYKSSSVSTHMCKTVCTHFLSLQYLNQDQPDLQSEPCFQAHRFMAEPKLSPRAVQISIVILLWVVLLYCQCCFLLIRFLCAVILTASARLQYVKTIKTSKQSAGDVPECASRKAFSALPLALNRYLLSSVSDNSSGLLHWGYSAVAKGLLWQFVCLGVKCQHWIDTF